MKQPLAYRIRPNHIDEIIGQDHLVQGDGVLRRCMISSQLFSMIFFGPPGTGKTTVAIAMAKQLKRPYRMFNAVTGNKKELDQIFAEAKMTDGLVVIMDEVHRLNRDKQDHLLPHIEDGTITLIGATTANPYFAINAAIRSRCHIFEFYPLTESQCKDALTRALTHPEGLNNEYTLDEDAADAIVRACNGDIRYALNVLEIAATAAVDCKITLPIVLQYVRIVSSASEDEGDGYYDLLSGFQKSIRGSDVEGAMYYLARLIQANDIDSIERRLLVTAYEDVGLANPAIVARTITACDTARRVGFPEARIPLSVAVIDLCLSPKSKSGINAIDAALRLIEKENHQIPKYLRLTPLDLKEEDKYPYDRPDVWPKLAYLPEKIQDVRFFQPESSSQYEIMLTKNLDELRKRKRSYQIRALKKER
ncbi:MAG: replication-associated recombination protein A [Erysipelotrichaceae bacterium]|nr:replication-associated recombination protein A [Erysipelotrichaceae bacterium]